MMRTKPVQLFRSFIITNTPSLLSMSSPPSLRATPRRYQRHRGLSSGGDYPNVSHANPPPPTFNSVPPPQHYFYPNQTTPLPPPPRRWHQQQNNNNNNNRQFPPHHEQLRRSQQRRALLPADFRLWEPSSNPDPTPSLPSNFAWGIAKSDICLGRKVTMNFKVLSYNLLADYLAITHRGKLYFHIPRHILDWSWRRRSIFFELGLWSADILCFQEVDRFQDLEEELKFRGYSGIWKMRTGDPIDGCAIFWRASRFRLLHEECIEYNKLGLRDNVAQICVFELTNQNNEKSDSLRSLSFSKKIVVCNIHVLYNPRRGEIKLGQVRVLLDKAHAVSKHWDNAPVVLCGDFNCTPKSPLYNFISEQKLDLSDLPRDKVSGQASAEIRPQWQFNPNLRSHQSADYRGGATQMTDSGEIRHQTMTDTDHKVEYFENEPISASSVSSTGLKEPLISQDREDLFVDDLKDGNESFAVDSSFPEYNTNNHEDESRLIAIGGSRHSPSVSVSSSAESSPNVLLHEKMENLSIDGTAVLNEGDVDLGEDSEEFHDGNAFISHDLNSEPLKKVFNTYDPSAWTPMETESATGSSSCTFVEHSLKLKSSYTEVEDLSGTRDSHGEPLVSSYNRCFLGTVDYIWRSEGLKTVRVLAPIPKKAMQWTPGFPTKKWGSDHIALVSELAFTNDSFPPKTASPQESLA